MENQIKDLKRIYPKLQKWKKDLGVIDYGDMISLAYKLIISNKSALDSIRNQYKHIIIDEFQDNNYALNTIISLIVDAQNSITVVGDDDQVIYSFRGANSYNIQSFKNKYKSDPEFKIISLEQNYRSSQPILDVANSTIKNNDRINKVLFSKKENRQSSNSLPWNLNNQNQFLIQSIKRYKILNIIKLLFYVGPTINAIKYINYLKNPVYQRTQFFLIFLVFQ